MSTASTLLDRTERLQTRLDNALTKHAKTTLPRRKDAIKDSVKRAAHDLTRLCEEGIGDAVGLFQHLHAPRDTGSTYCSAEMIPIGLAITEA